MIKINYIKNNIKLNTINVQKILKTTKTGTYWF